MVTNIKKKLFFFSLTILVLTLTLTFFLSSSNDDNFYNEDFNFTILENDNVFYDFEEKFHQNINPDDYSSCDDLNSALLDKNIFSKRVEDNIYLFEGHYFLSSKNLNICFNDDSDSTICCYDIIKYE